MACNSMWNFMLAYMEGAPVVELMVTSRPKFLALIARASRAVIPAIKIASYNCRGTQKKYRKAKKDKDGRNWLTWKQVVFLS